MRRFRTEEKNHWLFRWMIHANDGPAIRKFELSFLGEKLVQECWYSYNKLHRRDGPAVINYYLDGLSATEQWYLDGCMHRIDGPAEIHYYSPQRRRAVKWALQDKILNFEEWKIEVLNYVSEEQLALYLLEDKFDFDHNMKL